MTVLRVTSALAILAFCGAISPAVAAEPLHVTLSSQTAGQPQDIPATVFKPEGQGPFPAVVILHDCSGLGQGSSGAPFRWSRFLEAEGYVTILPDSFTPRGMPKGVCDISVSVQQRATAGYATRARDAYAALRFLRSADYVGGMPIGVMGGSHGGSSTLSTLVVAVPEGVKGFAAGIAFYPGCGALFGKWNVAREFRDHGAVTAYRGTYVPTAPLRILIGDKDDWTPAVHCEEMAKRSREAGLDVTIKVYPGANHSFDSPNPVRYIDSRSNVNKPTRHGATTGGDPAAWKDSMGEVKRFFAEKLGGRSD
jgi:dienelactone hydrolase